MRLVAMGKTPRGLYILFWAILVWLLIGVLVYLGVSAFALNH